MKMLYPDTFPVKGLDLPEGIELCVYDPYQPVPREHEDADILIVWQPAELHLRDTAKKLKNLKWIQSLSSGTEKITNAGFDKSVIITGGRGLHDMTVAEHALCLILACARRTNLFYKAQLERRWAGELGGAQPVDQPDNFTTLRDARVLIWGFGSIARQITPLLNLMGAKVTGIANHAAEFEGVQVYPKEDVEKFLPKTDLLLMILPNTQDTDKVLNKSRMAMLPRHAWVVNVGRGNSIDEKELAKALWDGVIAGAALDVFEKEPLPADSPLWRMTDNVIISPHAAGGRPYDGAKLINYNLRRFLENKELKNIVSY